MRVVRLIPLGSLHVERTATGAWRIVRAAKQIKSNQLGALPLLGGCFRAIGNGYFKAGWTPNWRNEGGSLASRLSLRSMNSSKGRLAKRPPASSVRWLLYLLAEKTSRVFRVGIFY